MTNADAAMRQRLTDIAGMVEALVSSLSNADDATRADLGAKITSIAGKRAIG